MTERERELGRLTAQVEALRSRVARMETGILGVLVALAILYLRSKGLI